ncbi:MAG: 2-oxo acid dehydrogenase subunit E2 [Lachnospiraceae bacterium]|nr:2-oxo acid dehydrogenase subunit E2 [Lachnospiraceae bacterium]
MSKKRWGDRKDGTLIRDLDSMHFIMGHIYRNRTDNEAFISETLDLTNVDRYLAEKNVGNEGYQYNLFQVLVCAFTKAVHLRPRMNRFIVNRNYYQRNEVTSAFVVRVKMQDESNEGLAFIHSTKESTIDTMHEEIVRQIMGARQTSGAEHTDTTTDAMDMFNKMPRFVSRGILSFVKWLDKHGWVPNSLIETDANYASVFFTNLGSIKLQAGYHHLSNWGTTSVFVIVGEKKKRPFFNEDGTYEMRDSVEIGMTVDERIADGYYYAKTIRLVKKLIENPALLELPFGEEIDYE